MTGGRALVSVVIPTQDRSTVLPRAIESVLAQSYRPLELIVVDDGSADGTPGVVRSYDQSKVRYIRLEERRGPATARNVGIEAATGEYISFLDSDDEYLPGRTERMIEALKDASGEYIGICHGYREQSPAGYSSVHAMPSRIDREQLRHENPLGISATLFETETIEAIGSFDESLATSEDYDLYVRASAEGPILGLRDVLSIHHVEEDSLSQDVEKRIEGQKRLEEKHAGLLSAQRRSRHRYARFFLHADVGDTTRAREALREAIAIYPYDPLYYYHYLSSLGGPRGIRYADLVKRCLRAVRARLWVVRSRVGR